MGIREQGYRHWQGKYSGHAFRWWTVAKQAIRATAYTKVRLFGLFMFIVLMWVPYFFYGLFWFLAGAAGGRELGEFLFGGSPDEVLRANLYDLVRGWQVMVLPIYIAAVAAPFISNDLRSNALYIYLSKPLRRGDYIVGKLAATALIALPVTILPGMFVWLMAIGSSDNASEITHPWEILFEIVLVQVGLIVVLGAIVLAASSLTKRWWIAFAAVMGGYYILHIMSNILQDVIRENSRDFMLVSPSTNFINYARTVYERPELPPEFAFSFLILLGVAGAGLGVFLWKILRLEVAE